MKTTLSTLLLLLASGHVLSEELAEQYTFANVSYQEGAVWTANTVPNTRFADGSFSFPASVAKRPLAGAESLNVAKI